MFWNRHAKDGDRSTDQGELTTFNRGIYTVAYDSHWSSADPPCELKEAKGKDVPQASAPSTERKNEKPRSFIKELLLETLDIAPLLLLAHFLGALWRSVESALQIYFTAKLLMLVSATQP